MAKLDPLDTITSGFGSTALLNSNFAKLTTALDNTLSRDGSAPNFMDSVLDMNSNRIINLADPVSGGDAVSFSYIQTLIAINSFETIVSDNGSTTADLPNDTLTISGGTDIATAIVGDTLTINYTGAGGATQNLFETVSSTSGAPTTAGTPTDTLTLTEGTNMTITGDGAGGFTFDATGGATQNLFETVDVDGTPLIADTTTDTLSLVSGGGITLTPVAGTDTITISSSALPVSATQFTNEAFADTIGYTAGVSNSITLGFTPFSADSLLIFFKGVAQHVAEIASVIGNVVTFTSVIPVGVTQIQVYALDDPVYGGFLAIPDQSISSGGALGPFAHGLASAPTHFEVSLVCQVGEAGHAPGDVIPIDLGQVGNRGVAIKADGTNVNLRYGSDANVFEVLDFTTGTSTVLTNASWELRVRAIG